MKSVKRMKGGRPIRSIPSRVTRLVELEITPEIEDKIADNLAKGCNFVLTIDALGIRRETVYKRLRESEEFRNKLSRARERLALGRLENIAAHEPDDWRASAWILERALPDYYGKSPQVVIQSGQTRTEMVIEAEVLPPKVTSP